VDSVAAGVDPEVAADSEVGGRGRGGPPSEARSKHTGAIQDFQGKKKSFADDSD